MPQYFANAATGRPRRAPGELPCAIGVLAAPDRPKACGIAYPAGHVGGWAGGDYLGRPKATWRLVVDGEDLDGR
jgi:hypothetical protein